MSDQIVTWRLIGLVADPGFPVPEPGSRDTESLTFLTVILLVKSLSSHITDNFRTEFKTLGYLELIKLKLLLLRF